MVIERNPNPYPNLNVTPGIRNHSNKWYLIPATSNGDSTVLKTRKVSGKDGSCVKHHMKLHIYVCQMDKGKITDCQRFHTKKIIKWELQYN